MEQPTADLAAFNRFVKTLWVALFVSVCLYWPMLGWLNVHPQDSLPAAVEQVFMGVAAAAAVATLVLRFNRIPALQAELLIGTDVPQALAKLRTLYVISYVLAESVALYGFVLYFLGMPRSQAAYFFIGSAALFLLCYPRALEERLVR